MEQNLKNCALHLRNSAWETSCRGRHAKKGFRSVLQAPLRVRQHAAKNVAVMFANRSVFTMQGCDVVGIWRGSPAWRLGWLSCCPPVTAVGIRCEPLCCTALAVHPFVLVYWCQRSRSSLKIIKKRVRTYILGLLQ
ncbi:unnamed protein product, partial [Laminaria digitata]